MWVDSKERLPEKDGEFVYQNVFGSVSAINYTVEGGWNTHRSAAGELYTENVMENDGYIARWFDAPEPDPIPEEWYEEYVKS